MNRLSNMTKDTLKFKVLQIAAFTVFLGRAYQHLFWDAPYRELLWDPNYMEWIVAKVLTMPWGDYVTHPDGDLWFQNFVIANGIFYLAMAAVVLFVKKLPKLFHSFLLIGAVNLIFLAAIYLKDKFFHVGQFFEYTLQFASPIFLFLVLRNFRKGRLILFMKIAVAITFICHGLYAIGYYPRPFTFMTMTQNILGINGSQTDIFLSLAGIADFVVAAVLFLPKKWSTPGLIYCVIWGFLTAMARIVGNFYWEFPIESLNQWVFEAVYRFPHFLIPLYILIELKSDRKHLS